MPGFAILGRIGRGAASTVWSARDLDNGIVYALKISATSGGERTAAAARAEAREISLLRRLDHPNLVRLHRVVDLADGRRALVLDLAEIGSLADLLAVRGALREGEACRLLAPVAQALAHLHARGVVHADISAGNVLIAVGGRALLGDLGVARTFADARRGSAPPAGARVRTEEGAHETPGFGAPELAAGSPATPASDVWSLGAVLGVCLGKDPGSLGTLVTACTAPDPAARPTADLVERVLRLAASPERLNPEPAPSIDRAVTRPVAVPGREEPHPQPPPESRRRSRFASGLRSVRRSSGLPAPSRFVAAGLVLAAAATASTWWLAGGGPASARPAKPASHGGDRADPVIADPVIADPVIADPVVAVQDLAEARARLLNSGSSADLATLDLRGSSAWRDDARLLSTMSRRGVRLRGLHFAVASARLLRWEDEAAVVRTEVEVSAHELLGATGAARRVPAGRGGVVDLVLGPDADGNWRVRETERP